MQRRGHVRDGVGRARRGHRAHTSCGPWAGPRGWAGTGVLGTKAPSQARFGYRGPAELGTSYQLLLEPQPRGWEGMSGLERDAPTPCPPCCLGDDQAGPWRSGLWGSAPAQPVASVPRFLRILPPYFLMHQYCVTVLHNLGIPGSNKEEDFGVSCVLFLHVLKDLPRQCDGARCPLPRRDRSCDPTLGFLT